MSGTFGGGGARCLVVSALIVTVAALSGCASGGTGVGPDSQVTVYVSAPLRGHAAAEGRDAADGARMALAEGGGRVGELGVRAVYLDDAAGAAGGAGWSPTATAANARRATQDSTAIAYIGDLASGATRFSLPITNEAHLLQVSPASAAVDLVQPYLGSGDQVPEEVQPTGERTFGRVIPSDEAQAHAGALWAKRLGSRGVTVIRGKTAYDDVMAESFRDEARAIGLRVTDAVSSDLAYAAVEPGEQDRLGGAVDFPRVMGADALIEHGTSPPIGGTAPRLLTAAAQDPAQLPPAGRRFVRDFRHRYGRRPGPHAAYGYEAMAVVLDSIRRAGERGTDRDAVIDAFLETTDRDSILGTYSIDDVGDTTLDRLTGYRVIGGRPVPIALLRSE